MDQERKTINEAFDQLVETVEVKDSEGTPLLYRVGEGKGIKLNSARLIASRMKKQIGIQAEAVATDADLPESVRQQMKRDGVTGKVKGAYDPDTGTAYIVASNLDSNSDAVKSILHEVVGHKGVRQALKDKLNMTMLGIYRDMPAEAKLELEERYKGQLNGLSNAERKVRVAEEYVAHLAESNPKSSLLYRVISKVKRLLRNILPGIKWTHADVAEVIQAGQSALAKTSTETGDVLYSLAGTANGNNSSVGSAGFTMTEENWQEAFVRKIQDKFKPLKRVQDAISSNSLDPVSEERDAYLAEELSHGKMAEDLRRFEKRHKKPLAKAIANASVSLDELDLYLYAKHAPERNAHIARINDKMPDGGSGMTNQQAANILARFDSAGKIAELQALANRVNRINRQRINLLRDAGLEKQEALDSWDRYQNYVPLKGKGAEVDSAGHRQNVGKGFDIRGRESMRAMGRRSLAESPTLHSLAAFEESLVRKGKNEVGETFLKLVEDNPNKDYWEIFSEDKLDTKRMFDPRTEQVVDRANPMMKFDQNNYFSVKRDGKEYYIKLKDKQLLEAMHNLGPEKMGTFMQLLSKTNRILASVNTSLNPEFVISNFSRDIQTAVLNVIAEQDLADGRIEGEQIAKQVIKDVPAAMKGVWRNLREAEGEPTEYQKWFDDFQADGGKIDFFGLTDFDSQSSRLNNLILMEEGGTKGELLKRFTNLKELIEDSNAAVENAVRLSAYVNARKAGVSRKQSASLAKNLTVNFNRKGELGVFANALYMFFNASVQGTAQFVRVMKSHKTQKIAAGLVAASVAMAEWNRMVAGEDDDGENWWDKVPDYVKERNLVIMKWWKDDGSYMTVPLPYGYNIFHVTGNVLDDLGRGQKDIPEASVEMVKALLGSFNPIGLQDSNDVEKALIKSAAPTVLSPIAQLAVNENFYGAPIYREGFPGSTPRPDSSQSMKTTKEHYKAISTWLNEATGGTGFRSGWLDISPDSIEHIMEFATGGVGMFGDRSVNALNAAMDGSELDDREIPFWRKLNGKVSDYQDISTFYERLEEVNQYRDEYRSLRESEREEYREDFGAQVRLSSIAKSYKKRLSKLNDRLDKVRNSDRSEVEKQAAEDQVQERINQLVDQFNLKYGELVE